MTTIPTTVGTRAPAPAGARVVFDPMGVFDAVSLPAVEEPFLAALQAADQAALRERGAVRRFARGAPLFHEQTVPSSVIVLLDGRVKLTRVTSEGRDVLLAIRGPGDLLGEQSALDGEPRSATAMALEAVEALSVPADAFLAFVARTPVAALYVMRSLSERLRDADDKRVGFSAQDTLGRVASRLVELGERYGEAGEGEGLRIDLPITQEDLAAWTGTSREGVTRALTTLRSLGWVDTGRRSITVLDLDALRGRSVMRLRHAVLTAAVALACSAAPAAADTTVIGSLNLPAGGQAASLNTNGIATQAVAGDANYVVGAPVAGTVTSWSFAQANLNPGATLRLRVLRPAGGGQYTLQGTSVAEPVDGLGDHTAGPFSTSLAIQAGDQIAIESTDANGQVPDLSGVAGADRLFHVGVGASPDGTTLAFDDGNGGLGNNTQSLVQATITFTPSVTNPPPIQTPPTSTAPSPPVASRSVDVVPVSGTVLVRVPGSKTFVSVAKTGLNIVVGTEVDVTHGRVTLSAVAKPGSSDLKTADFYGGRFIVTQPANAAGRVDLKLSGPLATCKHFTGPDAAGARAHRANATKPPPKPKKRYVWGSGHGTFRTIGDHGTAAVRGTIWLTEDRCDGTTLVVVKRGIVAVHDDFHNRTVLVKAGGRKLIKR